MWPALPRFALVGRMSFIRQWSKLAAHLSCVNGIESSWTRYDSLKGVLIFSELLYLQVQMVGGGKIEFVLVLHLYVFLPDQSIQRYGISTSKTIVICGLWYTCACTSLRSHPRIEVHLGPCLISTMLKQHHCPDSSVLTDSSVRRKCGTASLNPVSRSISLRCLDITPFGVIGSSLLAERLFTS